MADAMFLQTSLIKPQCVLQMTKGQLLIKRVIMLVVLLDQTAMLADLPSQAPLLFGVSGSIKSSAEVRPLEGLLIIDRLCCLSEMKAALVQMAGALLRKHLQGEHDVVRALAKFGCILSYQQAPSDEIKFSISMLAVDLRDGIRLHRLMECLTGTA